MRGYRLDWQGTVIAVALLAAVVIVALYADGALAHDVVTALIGAIVGGAFLPPAVRRESSTAPKAPRVPPPLPLLLLALALSGCGAGALGVQADTIAGAGAVFAEADTMIVTMRARDLDAIVDEARETCAPDGCSEEQAAEFRRRLEERTAHWAPVLACREPVPEALRAWVDALDTARLAATEELGIATVVQHGLRAAAIYASAVSCAEAIEPSLDLPALPIGGAP